MANGLREKLERFIVKAEFFLKNDIRVFLVDIEDNYYLADVLFVGQDKITIQSFKGKLEGTKTTLLWADVIKFEEYKENP